MPDTENGARNLDLDGAKSVLTSLGNKFVFRVSIFLICKTRRARKLTNMWILCKDLET